MRLLVAVLFLGIACTGCSNKELYKAGRGWQHTECQKIVDNEERARCMEAANKSHEQYEKEREEIREQ